MCPPQPPIRSTGFEKGRFSSTKGCIYPLCTPVVEQTPVEGLALCCSPTLCKCHRVPTSPCLQQSPSSCGCAALRQWQCMGKQAIPVPTSSGAAGSRDGCPQRPREHLHQHSSGGLGRGDGAQTQLLCQHAELPVPVLPWLYRPTRARACAAGRGGWCRFPCSDIVSIGHSWIGRSEQIPGGIHANICPCEHSHTSISPYMKDSIGKAKQSACVFNCKMWDRQEGSWH